ncbi:PCYCGC domain-containing protein [Caldalkalibacillus thermarum TA2.A1]|uniref:PCYCGC domain-containing protein n=1 Tax=Caldalkalibacillus thermarum (strain TA2.A1) TaxID=986075 RepID=A0A8X8I6V0_CALTT|nr:PCYCGC domain-containing protein [Caldalkalibacillus thermarum TA2.A1]
MQQGIEQGYSLTEIRDYIDDTYSRFGVKPTPAPYPPEETP